MKHKFSYLKFTKHIYFESDFFYLFLGQISMHEVQSPSYYETHFTRILLKVYLFTYLG